MNDGESYVICVNLQVVMKRPIAFNALPQIDVFTDNDYLRRDEDDQTKKIMEDDSIAVSATCTYSSPVQLTLSLFETEEVAPVLEEEVKAAIAAAFPGAVLEDDVAHQIYP